MASEGMTGRATFHDNRDLFATREGIVAEIEALGDGELGRAERRQKRAATARLDQVTMEILHANAGLVHAYAAKFCGLSSDVDAEDHVSAGYEGLLQAIRSYRTGGGASFARWAYPFIKRAILGSVRNQDFPHLSSADFDKRPAILEVARELRASSPHAPVDPAEVASIAGVPEAMVRRVLEPPKVVRIYGGEESDDSSDIVSHVPDPDADVAAEVLRRTDLDVLAGRLRKLDDTELFMVVRKYGLDGEPPALSVDLSRMSGVSRQRVRATLDSGLAKLADKEVLQQVVG